MGLFDFFKKGNASGADAQEKALARHAERVMDKRSMSPDRFASIEYLARLGTEEAWRALLPRFNFTVDPSITDREEKQYIFDSVTKGDESAIEPLKEFLRTTSAVNWPIKMLREMLSPEDFVSELLDILKKEDTSYQKNPERKIQAIVALEKSVDPRVAPVVAAFLEDASEDTRFYAVRTLLAQDDASCASALAALLARDDSMRVRTTVVDGVAAKAWPIPEEHREKVSALLSRMPNGPFSLNADGVVSRVGR